jgi:putative flippase GtrA
MGRMFRTEDSRERAAALGTLQRWLSFHVSTGVISVLTNLSVTILLTTVTGLPVVPANVIAVAIASFANFWINDRLVFRPAPALTKPPDSAVPRSRT